MFAAIERLRDAIERRLVSDWRKVLRYGWSVRLLAIAGLLSGAEVALPFLQGLLPIPNGVFAALSGLTTAGAFVARIVAQRQFQAED